MNQKQYDRIVYLITLLKTENVTDEQRELAQVELLAQVESLVLDNAVLQETSTRYHRAIHNALHRYDNPDEPHNKAGGFPRGELAWAMANDLRKAT